MYSIEEKQQIDRVAEVFHEFLRDARNEFGMPKYDLVWMNNLQCYLFIINYKGTQRIKERDLLMLPINSAEELYHELIDDIIEGIYSKSGFWDLDREDLTESLIEMTQSEIMRCLVPYMDALPEYYELTMQTVNLSHRLHTDANLTLDDIVRECTQTT